MLFARRIAIDGSQGSHTIKDSFFGCVFYIFWGPAASGISSLWWFQSICHQILRVDMVRLRLNPG